MEDKNKQKKTTCNKTGNATQTLIFRLAGAGLVLYWLWEIVRGYMVGGPEAPSLALLIIACVVLGIGAGLVILQSVKSWKKTREEKQEEE